MGFYINPMWERKKDWLKREAFPIPRVQQYSEVPDDKVAICLVHNGAFTAALVCVDQREIDAAFDPMDTRPKQWYLADREKVYPICSGLTEKSFA